MALEPGPPATSIGVGHPTKLVVASENAPHSFSFTESAHLPHALPPQSGVLDWQGPTAVESAALVAQTPTSSSAAGAAGRALCLVMLMLMMAAASVSAFLVTGGTLVDKELHAPIHPHTDTRTLTDPIGSSKPSQHHQPDGLPKILVVAVTNDSEETRLRIAANMRAQPGLDFGVVLYSGKANHWTSTQASLSVSHNKLLLVRQGALPPGSQPSKHGFIPKHWFQAQVVDWVRGYDYVWMVDEDMSFDGFDSNEFWKKHTEAFSQGAPLITQPTVTLKMRKDKASILQRFDPGRHEWWDEKRDITKKARKVVMPKARGWLFKDDVPYVVSLNHRSWLFRPYERAAIVQFVEQQAPVFDVEFWLWWVKHTSDLRQTQIRLSTDWGADAIWCAAAWKYDANRSACAIIDVPIIHEDSQTIGWHDGKEAQGVLAGNLSWKRTKEMVPEKTRDFFRRGELMKKWIENTASPFPLSR